MTTRSTRKKNLATPPVATASPPLSLAGRVMEGGLVVAVVGSAWLVDPYAEAAFDAPKRLVTLAGVAIAAAGWLWRPRSAVSWRDWTFAARLIVGLLGVAVIGLVASALASPHPAQAWDSVRLIGVGLLLLPLGASALLDGPGGGRVLRWIALAIGANLLISLLQFFGLELPLGVAHLGGRFPTGALLGNEGYVAIVAALSAAALAALALNTLNARLRWQALACGLICIVVIGVNRQVTSAAALAVGLIVLVAVWIGARWLIAAGAAVVVGVVVAAVVPPLRDATWARLPGMNLDAYQAITTYRVSAWAAADDMLRTRPLLGYGPGTYAAESQTHRFAAEMRERVHLLVPPNASGFAFAHQDYLQLAAEAGVPTLLALLGAFGTLVGSLARRAGSPGAIEPLAVLAVLVVGAVAALAWFPMQIPFIAVLLLLAAGRGFRWIARAEVPP